MPIRPIARMGAPILRERAREVSDEELRSEEFQGFLDDLLETCREASGAGIAAPQVFDGRRVFLIEVEDNPRYPDAPAHPLTFAINPVVTRLDQSRQDVWEGCLSIPDVMGRVRRAGRVRLDALDREGQEFSVELAGFAAAVAQHELDHLDGILYLDRMEDMRTLTFRPEWMEHVAPGLAGRTEAVPDEGTERS